jgi:hypothetical protein
VAQDKRKEADIMKEEMIVEEQVIPEVVEELIDTTHLLTQQEMFMHPNIP